MRSSLMHAREYFIARQREKVVIAEIGVEVGNHAHEFLTQWPEITECHLIDIWDNEEHYQRALENVKQWKDKVTVHRCSSIDAAKLFNDEYFDFVYIDANHEYDFVKSDIEHWLPKLKKFGIIAGHDWDKHGVTNAVNDALGKSGRVNSDLPLASSDWWMQKTNMGRRVLPVRYTYGMSIMTFRGSLKVDRLLHTIAHLPSMEYISKKFVIEDKCPVDDDHEKLVEVLKKYPDWHIIPMGKWGNAQGTAQEAFEHCETDFMWLLEDDQLAAGDPFFSLMQWLEECPQELADVMGGINPTKYSYKDLRAANVFPEYEETGGMDNPKFFQRMFFENPFETWYKNPPIFPPRSPYPTLCTCACGQGSLWRRDVWKRTGGVDQRWHAFDQTLSYNTWLQTPYLIMYFPTDPLYHCGGCSHPGDYYGYQATNFQGDQQRCIEIYGANAHDIEVNFLNPFINNKLTMWSDKFRKAYAEWKKT